MKESIDHPAHYGGADNPYEAIKVIKTWDLNFSLGNCVKYICRAGKKVYGHDDSKGRGRLEAKIIDLNKAMWYLRDELLTAQAQLAAMDKPV